MEWYRANARDLPWRHSCDLTYLGIRNHAAANQVATVIPYYLRFLNASPRSEAWRGHLDEILPLWSGLGYTSASGISCRRADGPEPYGGPYPVTQMHSFRSRSRPIHRWAILSLAYNLPQPLVDGM